MKTFYRILSFAFSFLALWGCGENEYEVPRVEGSPIYPDYQNVTVPYNIAPLNFEYAVQGAEFGATRFTWNGGQIVIRGKKVKWNEKKWREMLSEAKGEHISVFSSTLKHTWMIYVSEDPIDKALEYRLIEPGYEVYSKMGVYERDLTTFKEHPLIENTDFDGCVNCHSFNRADPSAFSLHIRGPHGATLIQRDGKMEAYNTKTDATLGFCVYPYWHPSGKYIAYSTNNTRQGFHMKADKLVEVFDNASDLQVYDVENNELITAPEVKVDSLWETFPSFSPDGRTLYFCRAQQKNIPDEVKNIRYNLCKVDFDPETGAIGQEVTVLVNASAKGKSVSFPRPSYDGKFLMYTLSDYGQFSIWHHEADLWLLNLETGESTCLNSVNSNDTESYHNFSSTSRWFVFSSRRDDGLFTRPYFAHIDEDGNVTKAFMLPQNDPVKFYRERFLSYNIPEFVTAPVELDKVKTRKLITSDKRVPFGLRK